MFGLIDYKAAIHLWHVDKFDFLVCMSAYFGVVFASVEIGLVIALVLANPGAEVMKKLNKSKFIDTRTRMDLSNCGGSCGIMQLHASLLQNKIWR
ncbi:hypothetical protein RND71_024474 [Anisodus tanguticus]|uniref:Uncharacterized protein n=1 Tax=Anisodus tanguticus TaxID=243964 RepID=A0AAE1RR96_9SOLA|nr:hypothetical protein RND71_024474 [Anisodus tanguticus]